MGGDRGFGGVDRVLVVATAEVLDEECPRATTPAVRFVFSHGLQPGLEPALVALNLVVLVLAGVVPLGRKRVLNHVGGRLDITTRRRK